MSETIVFRIGNSVSDETGKTVIKDKEQFF
jgi:hypothetical protein